MGSRFNRMAGEPVRIGALAVVLFSTGAGLSSLNQNLWQADDPAPACSALAPQVSAEPFLRTELFFGLSRPDGSAISERDWALFLDEEVTPRFPEGLTVLSAHGQWQGANDQIVEERSKILILLYPRDASNEKYQEIEEIRAAYETRFLQEAVLRVDDDRPVCTSL